ncbi:extracellular matrix-binding ebh [Babesia caballi]|uniref:Extracellular matrix-binding ebh n=1 Tax=Babesia caballi TaxID=5871 RepID=A0AAV4LRR1_BABCB|nr:extracellular matrix-binding ebh [Babesia caballi]
MSTGKQLTDCPSNLKEAIDWILRVTGKDGGGGGGTNGTEQLADAVSKLSKDVKASSPELKEKLEKIEGALGTPSTGLIESLATGLATFIGYSGTNGIKSGSYKSTYGVGARWQNGWNNSSDSGAQTCAQIFLGCVPIIFSALSYLYWKCKQRHSQGGWEQMYFNGSGYGQNLKAFMVGQGYSADHLSKQKGSEVATSLQSLGMSSVTATQSSHTDLLNDLNIKLEEALKAVASPPPITTNLNGHSLSALFYLCRCYFTGKQIMQSKRDTTSKHRPPTSIREMLYWLSGLQFSPYYSDIEKQIEAFIPQGSGLPVADSAIPASTPTSSGDTLTQSQMKGFLLSSCLSAPGVLGAIQGDSANSEEGEPWLYSLFSNTMNLQYPAGSALFNTLANYSYALQFQLGFLFSMCATNGMKCGWQECRYGEEIEPKQNSNVTVFSHICHAGCTHNSGSSSQCSHDGSKCGKTDNQGSPSPLQAFLTDNLNGFSRGHPSETSDHLATCSGLTCHVPLGFHSANLRQNAGTGNHIYAAFYSFCGRPDTPLRQLSEKLGCLTKRTPRTLGDLFGFVWHLNGQLFKNTRPEMAGLINKFGTAFELGGNLSTTFNNDRYRALTKIWNKMEELKSKSSTPSLTATVLSRSLEAMAPAIPFLYQLFMAKDEDSLPLVLFDLKQQCHKVEAKGDGKVSVTHNGNGVSHHNHKCSSAPADLFSLQNSQCSGTNCGPYFYPLTHSAGATYAPDHASVYLSWVAYLTDDFHEWFQNLLEEFKNIDCSKTGCRKSTSGGQEACTSKHQPGTHGNSDKCKCDSVVHCGGVLPVLYRHGFQFHSPHTLSGGSTGNDNSKRSCDKFHSALSNVLAESAPLSNLLTSIDDFLYLFRFYFFYNQSAFWSIYVCIILYTFFFLLDTLRVRSHLHFPSSNSIAPISLLGTGKAPALKKFTKLTYFVP